MLVRYVAGERMSAVTSTSSDQIVGDILRMYSRGSSEADIVRRLRELTPEIDDEHAREHLAMVLDGYAFGRAMGSPLFRSDSMAFAGPELSLAACKRGYRDGSRSRMMFKIIPLCVLIFVSVIVYKWWRDDRPAKKPARRTSATWLMPTAIRPPHNPTLHWTSPAEWSS
jgi:hypothetical protein